jgi:MFS transporter, CP family, cyanate transporter
VTGARTAGAPALPVERLRAAVGLRGFVVLGALVLAAINLRPALASVGPLLPGIRAELGLSGAQAGLLTTIPSLCFGIFAPLAPRLAVRFGNERTVLAGLVVIGVATVVRPTGGAALLFGGTLLAGVAIAITQAVLPAIVKRRFASRAVLAMGIYALSVNLGALLGASLSVPAALALDGSWRASLALWGAVSPVAIVAWLLVGRRSRPADPTARPARLPWRSGGAWALTFYMAGLSVIYIVTLTWIAPLYHGLGLSEAAAGGVLSVFTASQIASGLVVPVLAHHRGDRRWWLAVTVGAVGLGVLAMAVMPLTAPLAWSAVAGLGMGGAYPLLLTLFVDRAESPQHSAELTAMGYCGGYLLAAGGPALAGAISDATGSLALPFGFLAAVALLMVAVTPRLAVSRVEDA